jgi:hypothetical protein
VRELLDLLLCLPSPQPRLPCKLACVAIFTPLNQVTASLCRVPILLFHEVSSNQDLVSSRPFFLPPSTIRYKAALPIFDCAVSHSRTRQLETRVAFRQRPRIKIDSVDSPLLQIPFSSLLHPRPRHTESATVFTSELASA